MKIIISSIALLTLFSVTSYAQSTYSIKGSVADTAARSTLKNTSIMVLSAKDSMLRKFTRARADGSFAINDIPKGKYVLVFSYPEYADYTDMITLDETHKEVDFGRIIMNLKSKLLQDIIIKGEVTAIKMKGDTTEFNAKAYVIQPNSKVEDLLKQLPGIEVDKDGKITAQGETVTKVLVDGEEFFGDDPTLVTKNIRGDMVDKIQLYDKKSDQATFTGIDDGVRTKTLNIKLKEDKKNGYFGKIDAGIGTDKFYRGQALYNIFKAKEKFAGYISTANTGQSGLSWEDSQKYTDNSGDNGGNVLDYNGQGLPVSRIAGLHYDNKWNKDKDLVNVNYKAGSLEINSLSNTQTQNNLANGIINTQNDQKNYSNVFRQKLDVTYTRQIDTTSNIKIAADGAYRHTENNNSSSTVSHEGLDTLLNISTQTSTNNADQHIMNLSAFYTKKLKKKGRTYSVFVSGLADHNLGKPHQLSDIEYYNPNTGALASTQQVDQVNYNDRMNTQFNANITYSEPLSASTALVFNYGVNTDNNSANLRAYNQSAPGVYNVLIDSLSSFYKVNQVSNQLGIGVSYSKDKTVLNYGVRATNVDQKQIDENTGNVSQRSFINWNPKASYLYKFSQMQFLRLNYDGNTTQPSIGQLQPIKSNSNPLFIVVGNPDLKQSFTNNVSIFYSTYKVLTGQSFYINGAYSNTISPIVNNINTDIATGKSTSQAANINKLQYNFNLNPGANMKIKGPDINIGLSGSINGGVNYNLANGVLNTTNTANYSGRFLISKDVLKKYDIFLSAGPGYNVLASSLQNNNNYRTFSSYNYFNFYLPGKTQFTSDVNYNYTSKSQGFDQSHSETVWNVTLSKLLLKDSNLKLSLTGNDLLNQRTGFSRSAVGSRIVQTSNNTIQRYFMFSVTWDFNKMGGGVPSKN